MRILSALLSLKKIVHLRGKIEQAVYEMIHTHNVTMLRGEMYRFVLESAILYQINIHLVTISSSMT